MYMDGASSEIIPLDVDIIDKISNMNIRELEQFNLSWKHISNAILTESMELPDRIRFGEIGKLYDITGSFKWAGAGLLKSVAVDDEYYDVLMKSDDLSLVFIHNHPNNSYLSLRDLLNLMRESPIIATVAIGHSGDISIATKDAKKFNMGMEKYNNIIKLANRCIRQYGYERVHNDLIEYCPKIGIKVSILRLEAEDNG